MSEIPPYQPTATEALTQIHAGTLTVTTLATSLLTRIQTRNPQTHAWTDLSPPTILTHAAHLDSLPPSARGPLHGLPIAIKDVILTNDMPTTLNSDIYRSAPLTGVDAVPVMALRALGALNFGKTTTTEFAVTTEGGGARVGVRLRWGIAR